MNQNDRVASGGGAHGAGYKTTGAPQGSGYGKCRRCRHHTGAQVVAFEVFSLDEVARSSEGRALYAPSPAIVRAFCPGCSTALTDECLGLVEFHISTVDDPAPSLPDEYAHYAERISWLETTDTLSRCPVSFSSLTDQGC